MNRAAALFLLPILLLLVSSAGADNRSKFGLSDPNTPIAISADRFDGDQNAKTLVYTGNAVVRQGEVYLHTDVLRVNVNADGHTADKIYATGRVVVTSTSGTATGDNAVYDVDPRIITLTGHVVLVRDVNVMRGEKLTVDLVSGVAKMVGGQATASGANGGGEKKPGRIQGLFTPKSIENDAGGTNSNTP